MNTLTAAAKAQITKDWLAHFPGLGKYKPLQLLRRVGPILEGIVLERTSGNDVYRPTFHVHCLARKCSAVTMTLACRLRSERSGGPDSIPVLHHGSKHAEAASMLAKQSPLALSGNLTLVDVLVAYRRFHGRPGVHYDANLLYEQMARICGWAGDVRAAGDVVEEGVEAMRRWPAAIVEEIGGIEPWRSRVLEAAAEKDLLRATADEQAILLGAEALPRAELKSS